MTDTASGSYFASLAKARYLRLTTFKRKGTPVTAPVPGIVDGDRAYFGVSSRSGAVKRLQHTDGVQVAPCGMRASGWSAGATARADDREEVDVATPGAQITRHVFEHRNGCHFSQVFQSKN